MIGEPELKGNDPEAVLNYMSELHGAIKDIIGKPVAQLTKLVGLASEYCL